MSAAKTPLEIVATIVEKAIKKGADSADAVGFDSSNVGISVRKGNIENIERSESESFGLRVIIGKKQAIVSSNDPSDAALDEMVNRCFEMAKLSQEDPYTEIAESFLLSKTLPDLDLYDANEPSIDKLTDIAKRTEEAALAVKGINNSEGADAGYGKSNIALATSNGFAHEYKSSSSSFSVSVIAGDGTKMERDYDYSSARHYADLDSPETIGKSAAERTLKRLNPKIPPTGRFPIIFDKRVSKSIVGSFASAINGAAIARGTSFLKEQMGKQIFPTNISIINDPFIVRGLASRPFDAEGLAGKKINLIENGVLQEWLLDLRSAKKLGLQTNGNASRGTASAPSPSSSNLYMENGSETVENIISDIKEGLYIIETFGMGINLVTGDYSQGASGFWIENGKISYPVSELTIAGTFQEMFKNIIPANDLEFKYGTNCPTLRIDGMTVAGT